jgi:DNA gyrase subunit B
LDRRCDARVVAALLRTDPLELDDFNDQQKVQQAASRVQEYLTQRYPELCPLTASCQPSTEGFKLSVRFRPGASARPAELDRKLAEHGEYEQLVALEEDIRSIGPAPYTAKPDKGESTQLQDATALDAFIEERGRKGAMVSRYKGLGEMNAEELWETTMNPDARTFLQVKIDDPVRADELFSVLMGDQVEPRRQFIERNALNVRNLDI